MKIQCKYCTKCFTSLYQKFALASKGHMEVQEMLREKFNLVTPLVTIKDIVIALAS